MVIPGNYYRQKLYKLNFEKKKISIPESGLRFARKIENDHFGMSNGVFFFREKKVDQSVFWSGIHWRLRWFCNYSNIISGSQTKVEKTDFFIVFPAFDRDPEIIM